MCPHLSPVSPGKSLCSPGSTHRTSTRSAYSGYPAFVVWGIPAVPWKQKQMLGFLFVLILDF